MKLSYGAAAKSLKSFTASNLLQLLVCDRPFKIGVIVDLIRLDKILGAIE